MTVGQPRNDSPDIYVAVRGVHITKAWGFGAIRLGRIECDFTDSHSNWPYMLYIRESGGSRVAGTRGPYIMSPS